MTSRAHENSSTRPSPRLNGAANDDRSPWGITWVGQVARLEGRFDDAADHSRQALRFGHELGDVASMTEPLQGLAAVAISTGETERGVRLLGADDAIRERLGGGPPPEWLRLGDPLAEARLQLGKEAYDRAWAAERSMTVDDAIAEAFNRQGATQAQG